MKQINSFITFENVSYNYQNPYANTVYEALHDINFTIQKGEFITIVGPNGCGKSTLAKHCNGILAPTCGNVIIDGKNTKDESENLNIKQQVGLVLQNSNNQIVNSIVEEDVAFGLENLGVPTDEMRKIVDKTLKSVGLYEQRHNTTYSLSGGQKQRLAIAGVLAMNPDIIVFDEPTSMLDPLGRKDALSIISNLNKTNGTTIILITHYVEEALLADRVILMNKGQIEVTGTPKEVFSQINFIKQEKFELIQSTDLLYKLQKHDYNVNLDAFTDHECADEIIRLLEEQNA